MDLREDIRRTAMEIAPYLDLAPIMCEMYMVSACMGDEDAGLVLDVYLDERHRKAVMDRLRLQEPLSITDRARVFLTIIQDRWREEIP